MLFCKAGFSANSNFNLNLTADMGGKVSRLKLYVKKIESVRKLEKVFGVV